MNWKPFILPLLLILPCSSVFFLPKAGDMIPSAVSIEIPERIGGWFTQQKAASKEELAILADDTVFAKAICYKPREGEYDIATGNPLADRLELSIVLSGHDPNNSIHRPERCMPSQGHAISSSSVVPIKLANGRAISVRRLLSIQSVPLNQERTKFLKLNSATYYFFIGCEQITHSHMERTMTDVKDRLLRGMDQRWAYVSISMWYGKLPWYEKELSLEEAESKLGDFIRPFAEQRIDWNKIRG